MSPLRIENVRSGALAIIVPYGELDIMAADDLLEVVSTTLASRPLILGMDLRGLTFIDARGLGALIAAGRLCQAEGRRFFLVRGSEHIDRLLLALGMDGPFEIVSDVDDLHLDDLDDLDDLDGLTAAGI